MGRLVDIVGVRFIDLPMRFSSFIALGLLLSLVGCSSWKSPQPERRDAFMNRAKTQSKGGLTVTVGVPDRGQTKAIFGTSLYDSRVQPVWIRVTNQTDEPFLLIKGGVDREYFSPMEVAWKRKTGGNKKERKMRAFFASMDFLNPIEPGQTQEGYIFTNLEEGFKDVLVDLISNHRVESFTYVIEVPGLVTDIGQRDFQDIYEARTDITTEEELRMVLASLPTFTKNHDEDENGDPLNVVMIGMGDHIFSALIRSGWHVTEVTHGASAWKSVKSFLFGARYYYGPISSLYVFGRSQDLGLQKARHSINTRNHMRLWIMPYTYNGDPIWLGQVSRDIGVKLTWRTFMTHAIDPDIDETRNGLVGDLAYSQALAKVGFVAGSQVSTLEDPSYNLTPDVYYSDGLRAVMFFGERPRALGSIEFLHWEKPSRSAERVEQLNEYLESHPEVIGD